MSIESGSAGKYRLIERKPFALNLSDVLLLEHSTRPDSAEIVLNNSAVSVFLDSLQAKMREIVRTLKSESNYRIHPSLDSISRFILRENSME